MIKDKRGKMKKGAIQVETIIVIILALLALVIIAAAFTGGFNQLWSKIMNFSQLASVDESTAMQTCSGLCQNSDKSFCTISFVITGKEKEGSKKCADLGAVCMVPKGSLPLCP